MASRAAEVRVIEHAPGAFDGIDETRQPWQIECAADLQTRPPEVATFDVDRILPADDAPALVYGPPGSFKTWIALALCDAIVRGDPFLGYATRRRERALYLNVDRGAKAFRRRVFAVTRSQKIHFATISPDQVSGEMLREIFESFRGAFIVIDPFASVYVPNTREEPGREMRRFVGDLCRLYEEFDCGGLVIDHAHRPKERGSLGDYYGSVQKEAGFATMWSIEPATESDDEPDDDSPRSHRVRLVRRKLSEGPRFAPIDVDISGFPDCVTVRRAADAKPWSAAPGLEEQIVAWARLQPETFSQRKATDTHDIRGRAREIRTAFNALVGRGVLVAAGKRHGHPAYRLNDVSASGFPDAPRTHADSVTASQCVLPSPEHPDAPVGVSASPIGGDALTHSYDSRDSDPVTASQNGTTLLPHASASDDGNREIDAYFADHEAFANGNASL